MARSAIYGGNVPMTPGPTPPPPQPAPFALGPAQVFAPYAPGHGPSSIGAFPGAAQPEQPKQRRYRPPAPQGPSPTEAAQARRQKLYGAEVMEVDFTVRGSLCGFVAV